MTTQFSPESDTVKIFKQKLIESDEKLLKEYKMFLEWEIKSQKKKAELDWKYLRSIETGTDKETEQLKKNDIDIDNNF